MCVNDLPKLLRDGKKQKNYLSELRGAVCGEDLSVLMHKEFGKRDFAESFHTVPSVNLFNHVEKLLNGVKATYDNAGVTMILYADGCANPGKAAEDAERSSRREAKIAEFRALQCPAEGLPNPSDKSKITQLMKESCYMRPDILLNVKTWCVKNNVRLIGAPFETDPQEVADETRHGITQASSTVDSDFFALGSNTIVDNLSHSGNSGKCNIIRRDSSFLTPKLLGMDIPALPSLR